LVIDLMDALVSAVQAEEASPYSPEEWAKRRSASEYYLPEKPFLDPVPELGRTRRRFCKVCRRLMGGIDHDACKVERARWGPAVARLRLNICDGCGVDPASAKTVLLPCSHQYCITCIDAKYKQSDNRHYREQRECRICGKKVNARFFC
jgi:hypothetical protein